MTSKEVKIPVGQKTGDDTSADFAAVEGIRRGEMDWLGVLFDRYVIFVKSALVRTAPEMSAAELDEQVQELFVALPKLISRYDERGRLRAWLYSIAVKRARVAQEYVVAPQAPRPQQRDAGRHVLAVARGLTHTVRRP